MPLRLVLVDDDARFRSRARRTLCAEGAEVVAELDGGAGAADAVVAVRPDAVLVDIRMPDVDGLEVARQLRGIAGGTVVILISTIDRSSGRRLARGVGAAYLPKYELSLASIRELMPGGGAAPR